jgi:2-polyprenyl-6-methoxyphenol hydroxylase-like FAD-dependent oxidoreductase
MAEKRAIIIGGGIGGLGTAIALASAGIEAAAYEAAGDIQRIQLGAGLFLWPNGIRAIQELGLENRLREVAAPVERFELRTWRGDPLVEWNVGDMGRRLDAAPAVITRRELHSLLVDGVEPGVLTLGARCTGFTDRGDSVVARFDDGREAEGDVLIGADGINSVVRRQLLGAAQPRYAGYTAWRGIVEEGDFFEAETATVYWGPGARLVTYRVSGGRPYWLALANAPEGQRDPEGGHRAAVLARYAAWPEFLRAALEATEESAISRADVHDRKPVKQWGVGRVTLLGDAAHPVTPNLAQGAAYALEDAVVVSKALRGVGDAAAALRAYEQRRIPRAASMVNGSWRMGSLARWDRSVAVALRERIQKLMLNRGFFVKGLEKDLAVEFWPEQSGNGTAATPAGTGTNRNT